MKQSWPAPERNKGPILDVLMRVFPRRGRALEIASGSGQHAVHFARALSELSWQPSDVEPENLASIRVWVHEAQLPNLREPVRLDVLEADWGIPEHSIDAVFNANMIHIAPWACCLGLMRGVGHALRSRGVFVLYGPFQIGGVHTSESNERFDAGLRARDASWGVRDLAAVSEQAAHHGLVLVERVQMPANNQSLIFRRQ